MAPAPQLRPRSTPAPPALVRHGHPAVHTGARRRAAPQGFLAHQSRPRLFGGYANILSQLPECPQRAWQGRCPAFVLDTVRIQLIDLNALTYPEGAAGSVMHPFVP
jgi:hypothetical protein